MEWEVILSLGDSAEGMTRGVEETKGKRRLLRLGQIFKGIWAHKDADRHLLGFSKSAKQVRHLPGVRCLICLGVFENPIGHLSASFGA